jgi:hypothetical protein
MIVSGRVRNVAAEEDEEVEEENEETLKAPP